MTVEDITRQSTPTRVTSYRDRLIKRFDKAEPSELLLARRPSGPIGRVLSIISEGLVRVASIASTALGFVSVAAAIAGISLAVLLTLYLVAETVVPDSLPVRLPLGEPDFRQNLRASAVFFWFELFGIVGIVRMFDDFLMDRRNSKQIDNLLTDLRETIRIISQKRDDFAGTLDRSTTKDGLFDVEYAELNLELAGLRQAFILLSMCDPDLTPYVQAISSRILTILDRMVGESYDAVALLRQRHAAKDAAGLFEALKKLYEVTDPRIQGLEGLELVLKMARRAV